MKRRRAATGWSTLPCDLLGQISSHLSTDADHLHVHQVCAHWRAWTSPLAAFRPWIVALVGRSPAPGDDPNHSAWFPNRLHPRKVEMGPPPAGLPYCRGASRGWLALADDAESPKRLVLWDPASGAEVPLPCLSSVGQIFLSGDPLGSADWMAVASQRLGIRITKSFFWRPGDTAWSSLYEHPTAGVLSVAFHGGRVFYMDSRPALVVYDLNLGAPHRPPAMAGVSSFGYEVCRCERLVHVAHESVLVSCNGDLLLVVLRSGGTCERGGRPPPSSSRVSLACSSFADVYKLDWTPEKRLEVGERVMDLGEHSLFLGLSESFALSAKKCPAIRKNHIYCLARNWHPDYSRDSQHNLSDWAFAFDLGSDTLKGIPYPEELRDEEPTWWACSWLYLRSPLLKKQQQ